MTEARDTPRQSSSGSSNYDRLTRLRDYLEAKMAIVDILLAINLLVEGVVDQRGRALTQPAIAALANIMENPASLRGVKIDGAATLTLEAIPNPEERREVAATLREIHAAFAVGKGDYPTLKAGTMHLMRIIQGLDYNADLVSDEPELQQ